MLGHYFALVPGLSRLDSITLSVAGDGRQVSAVVPLGAIPGLERYQSGSGRSGRLALTVLLTIASTCSSSLDRHQQTMGLNLPVPEGAAVVGCEQLHFQPSGTARFCDQLSPKTIATHRDMRQVAHGLKLHATTQFCVIPGANTANPARISGVPVHSRRTLWRANSVIWVALQVPFLQTSSIDVSRVIHSPS